MSVPQFLTIDLKRVAEECFTPRELFKLAHCGVDPMRAVCAWTDPLMDGLEEVHGFEALILDYIKENYAVKAE